MYLGPALVVNMSRTCRPYRRAGHHFRPSGLVQIQMPCWDSAIAGLSPLQLLQIQEEVHMLLEVYEILHFLAPLGLSPRLLMTE